MTPEISITLSPNASAIMAKLSDNTGLGQFIAMAMDKQNEATVRDIKQRINGPGVGRTSRKTGAVVKKAGEYVGVNTGTLRKSIGRTMALWFAAGTSAGTGLEVTSSVGSGASFTDDEGAACGPCEYAAIHEFGGTINRSRPIGSVRLRTDRKGNLLRNARGGAIFSSRGHKLFTTAQYQAQGKTKHGFSINIPERSYVRRTINDRVGNYTQAISAAVVRWWRATK